MPRLGDIAEINPQVRVTLDSQDLVAFLPMEAIDETLGTVSWISLRHFKDVSKGFTRFTNGDVLIAKITPSMENGKCAVASGLPHGVGFGSTEFHILRAKPKVMPEWILLFWRNPATRRRAATSMTGSAGQKRVPVDFLALMNVIVRPLDVQERTIRIVAMIDRLRRNHRYCAALADQAVTSTFRELFLQGGTSAPTWPMTTLGDELDAIEPGINFPPVSELQPRSLWRVLKVSAVSSGDFRPEESKGIAPDTAFDDRLVVRFGDTIMSRANTLELVGAVARVRSLPPKVLLPDKLWRLKFREGARLLPDYVTHSLRSPRIRKEIENRASGTSGSMKNITQDDMAGLHIPSPPLGLQRRFAAIVDQLEGLRAKQIASAQEADYLLHIVLARAFDGDSSVRPTTKSGADA